MGARLLFHLTNDIRCSHKKAGLLMTEVYRKYERILRTVLPSSLVDVLIVWSDVLLKRW